MSNPFRAALGLLEMHNDGSWDDLGSAIRVLEAAGGFTKDDKERIANALDQMPYYTPIADHKCPGKVLRDKFTALLAALPNKGE